VAFTINNKHSFFSLIYLFFYFFVEIPRIADKIDRSRRVERVIFLKWLKNIFKLFSSHNDEDEINEYRVHNENLRHIENKGKELEAKVAYQYPKGKFRFPLISDEEEHVTSLKEKPRKTRRDNKEDTQTNEEFIKHLKRTKKREEPRIRVGERVSQNQRNYPIHENQAPSYKVPEAISEQEVKTTGGKGDYPTKILKKSSRPFKPTEIPSPIYGFTQRPASVTAAENDLEDHKETVHKPYTNPSSPFEEEIIEFEMEESATMKEMAATKIAEPLLEEEETYLENNQEVLIDSDDQLDDHDLDHLGEASNLPENPNPMDYTINEHVEYMVEDVEKEMTSKPIEEQATTSNDEPPRSEPVYMEEKEPQAEVTSSVKTTNTAERSHLPFNVLMLKQDKRKWEQKKIEKAMEKETLDRTKAVEAIGVQDSNGSRGVDHSENLYKFPSFELLNPPISRFAQENNEWIENQEQLLNEALKNFGVRAKVVNITQGPSVTRFEVQPEPGVKVNKITNLSDDIKLSLAAKDIRIEAPIPGKHTIGIEVPNKKSRPVLISEIIKSEAFENSVSPLTAVLGLDISGVPVVTDLKKMPHGLIAGATGSGKSVCINSILISLLYKASPQDLKLLLIDPKMVELAPYNHIPHLVSPVITDVKAATAALKWAVEEMERRYELFAHTGVRDINRFNEMAEEHKRYSEKLPFIVIIIDELADLMMMAPADVEESICRIAQKARACGIHLIIATQRPSVDVITGLIKANVPTRAAFSVSSQIDSRTIIDISGAEKLLGKGDMLFLENGSSKPVRLQGTFVSDAEIDLVVQHARKQQEPQYLFHQEELLKKAQVLEDEDELFYEACDFVIDQGGASTSSIQRRFKIGYNRAARLIDMMEKQGFISEPKGSKPRDVMITADELIQIQESTSGTFL
jgi:DNA segregation ATPase FtsK/SpoIIIE, S-DNA-T family